MNTGGNLSRRPNTGKQAPARDHSTRSQVNGDGVLVGPNTIPRLDLVNQGFTEWESVFPGHFPEGCPVLGGKFSLDVHEANLDIMSRFVKTCPSGHFVRHWENVPMKDIYRKRSLFCEWVADAKAQMGAKSLGPVAEIMGLSLSTLYKYQGESLTHKPSDEAMRKLGDYLGRDYRVLMDDPGTAPPGIDTKAWDETDEDTKIFNKTMFSMSHGMTPEIRSVLIQMAKVGHAKAIKRIEEENESSSKKKRK